MSLVPLTTEDINSTLISQIEAQISQTIPLLPVAFVRVLSTVLAGVVVLLYKYMGFIFLQLFVGTASFKETTVNGTVIVPLIEWGRLVGLGDPLPATAAELTATVTVENQTGAPIPAGTPLVYGPTGVIYITSAAVLRDAPTKVITVEAASDQQGGDGLGAIGNIPVGAVLSFVNPVADVQRDTVVASVVVTAADAEDEETYRRRVLDHFQKRPQGGALSDYELWAEEAAGIINAYPYVGRTAGTVDVYCEADPVSSGSPDGIPTQPQLDAALDSINLDVDGRATRRPANALAFTLPITRKEFTIDVLGLDAPDLVGTQQAIVDGMDTLYARFEPYIGGLSVNQFDRVTRAETSGEVFNIVAANGGTFSNLRLRTAPNQDETFTAATPSSSDDAWEAGGVVSLVDLTIQIASANTVGIRFDNVTVPAGAEILSAKLTFKGGAVGNVYSKATIYGEALPNPGTFTVAANNISSRAKTVNSVEWLPAPWTVDNLFDSPDMTAIIEEVIGISGWASGNAIAFIITADSPTDRTFKTRDDSSANSVQLTIQYRAPSAAIQDIDVYTLGRGEKAKVAAVNFP